MYQILSINGACSKLSVEIMSRHNGDADPRQSATKRYLRRVRTTGERLADPPPIQFNPRTLSSPCRDVRSWTKLYRASTVSVPRANQLSALQTPIPSACDAREPATAYGLPSSSVPFRELVTSLLIPTSNRPGIGGSI
jgi:hypothetical protein